MEGPLAVGPDVVVLVSEEETSEGKEDADAEEEVGQSFDRCLVYPWLGTPGARVCRCYVPCDY